MSILIFALIVLVVVALIVVGVGYLGLPDPFGRLIQALIVIIAALVILNRAGLV